MRLVNRLLGLVVSAIVAAAAVVLVIEVLAAQLDRHPLIVDWRHWPTTLESTPWSSGDTRTALTIVAAAALALLILELWPRRNTDLPVAATARAAVLIRRRDLERSVAGAIRDDVHGAKDVKASHRRRALTIEVRTDRTDTRGLEEAATGSVQAALQRLQVQDVPPLRVRVRGARP
jgi:hypothetical protein